MEETMPGSFKKGTAINAVPRPIQSDLKSERIVWEPEKPVRWSFMKVLRETSSLKEFYPEINPYTECYKVRDNTWALYNDSFDGAGDVWMYLIDGPEKCMIIDSSFGIGDLKGLIRHLVGDKEIIAVTTHSHFDHCYGSAQFGRVYCHEYEVPDLKEKNNPDIWDYLFNQTDQPIEVWGQMIQPGEPVYTKFDRKDIIVDIDHKETYQPYEIIGVPDGYEFDLGGGYIVEAVLLPGHTPGQCGFYDHHNRTLFSGDTSGMGTRPEGHPFREYCTVEAMYDALTRLKPRFAEMTGVFPGHGMLDQHPIVMQYLLDACTAVMKDPENCNEMREMERGGVKMTVCSKYIQQGSALRYTLNNVYKKQVRK